MLVSMPLEIYLEFDFPFTAHISALKLNRQYCVNAKLQIVLNNEKPKID
jgi:hypothetical protein